MNTKMKLALILSAAMSAGVAWADTPLGGPATPAVPATPATPAAPSAPAASPAITASDVLNSINADQIKLIMDAAGIPSEIVTNKDNYSLVKINTDVGLLLVLPDSCGTENSKTGACKVLDVESGLFPVKLTTDQLNTFNTTGSTLAKAELYADTNGQPVIQSSIIAFKGITAGTVAITVKNFASDMGTFKTFADGTGAKPATAGFNAPSAKPKIAGGAETMRAAADKGHNGSVAE